MVTCPDCRRPLTWCAPRFCPVCTYPPCLEVLAKYTVRALLTDLQPLLTEDNQYAYVVQQWRVLMCEIDQIVIDRPLLSDSQARRVKAEVDISRRFHDAIRRYEDVISLGAPAAEFCFLLHIAADKRTHYLQRLMAPRTTVEAVFDTYHFEQYDRIFWAGLRMTSSAQSTTADLQRILCQAVEAMRQALFEGLAWQSLSLMDMPIPECQELGILMGSGWIGSQISLKHNRRLATFLRKELATRGVYKQPLQSELYERLPSNTYRAWHDGQWKTLATLRTRIAYLVPLQALILG